MKIRLLGVMLFHTDKQTDEGRTDTKRTESMYVCNIISTKIQTVTLTAVIDAECCLCRRN